MSQQEETRRVVEAYFRAWTRHRTDEAYALLAESLVVDLVVEGAPHSWHTASSR